MLAIGVTDEATTRELAKLVRTFRVVTRAELESIRQAEWDAAVVVGGANTLDSHMNVVGFGCDFYGYVKSSERWAVEPQGESVATEFLIPDELDEGVRELVEEDLLQRARQRQENVVINPRATNFYGISKDRPTEIWPFLMDGDHRPLALRFTRSDGDESEVWALPAEANILRWVRAALRAWHRRAPDRFPVIEAWQERETWMTESERAVASGLEEARRHARAQAEESRRRIEDLERQLAAERLDADHSQRALLTARGATLADAVISALSDLGFDVMDVDSHLPEGEARREDLRIRDPEVPEWEALVEVRGYTRGARLNDLLRLGRFTGRYIEEQGRRPDAVWYIVNHFSDEDPDGRPNPLESNPEELATFAEDGGLIIDTRELFKAVTAQGAGADEIRTSLKAARGRWLLRAQEIDAESEGDDTSTRT